VVLVLGDKQLLFWEKVFQKAMPNSLFIFLL